MIFWMAIKTAPKDGTWLLLANDKAVFTGRWFDEDNTDTGEPGWIDGSINRCDELCTMQPTHWMPLPEPPKEPRP